MILKFLKIQNIKPSNICSLDTFQEYLPQEPRTVPWQKIEIAKNMNRPIPKPDIHVCQMAIAGF